MNKFSYLKQAFSNKVTATISILQLLMFAVAMLLFVKFIPWLTSHDISELSAYSSYTLPPPEWAKSFSVNHGDFYFYRESPSENRPKFYLVISGFLVIWVFLLASGLYVKKRIKQNAAQV